MHNMNEWELLPKTESERLLISAAVCEAWTGGLGLADATAVVTPVDLWLVKAKHSLVVGRGYGKNLKRRPQIVDCPSEKHRECVQTLVLSTTEGAVPTRTHADISKPFLTHNLNISCMKITC